MRPIADWIASFYHSASRCLQNSSFVWHGNKLQYETLVDVRVERLVLRTFIILQASATIRSRSGDLAGNVFRDLPWL